MSQEATRKETVGSRAERRSRPSGTTMPELIVSLGLVAALSAMAVPMGLSVREGVRAAQAARHLASVARDSRALAIATGRQTALLFRPEGGGGGGWALYTDGNRNGVRSADVRLGIDAPVGTEGGLAEVAPSVSFGLLPDVPDLDGHRATSREGVRLAAGNWLSFSPTGSSSSGTLYLSGPGLRQYAVRIFGATGRIRVLRFDRASQVWVAP